MLNKFLKTFSVLVLLLCANFAFGEDEVIEKGDSSEYVACYNFKEPINAPLRRPFSDNSPLPEDKIKKAKGSVQRGEWKVHWASAQAESLLSIKQIVKNLQNHKVTMSSSVDEHDVESSKDDHNQLTHLVNFLIKPFPFVRVRWTEKWVYSLWRGTENDPQVYHAAYQKIKGTSHIEHLCGSILVEQMPKTITRITLIEEAKATRTDVNKTLQSVVGTVKSIATTNP